MFYLVIVSIVWGLAFGIIKYNLTNLDSNFVAFLRMFCAFPIFLIFLRLSNLSKELILKYMLLGAVQYGLMYIACIKAYHYLAAHQVVLFTALTPIYVTLIDGFYKRKIRFLHLLTSFIAFVSCALIYYQPANITKGFLIGLALVQMSDICFAFGQVTYKKLRNSGPDLKDHNIFALMFLGAMIVTGLATTLSGGWASIDKISLKQLLIIVYLGSISSGICFFMWNKGGLLVNSGTLAIFNNLKIPLGIFMSIIVFGETTELLRIITSLSIICGCILLQERYSKN